MSTTLTIGKQILTMFLYMGIGFLLYRRKLITKEGSKSLAHLLLYCVLPCVIIRSFGIARTPENTVELLASLALAAVSLLLSMLISAILFRKSPIDNFGCAFSNAGFMGFPLITALLGSEAVFYAAGFVALLNALQWTYGQWVLTGNRKQISAGAVIKNPIIISLAVGLILFFTGISLPSIIANTMSSLAALNAPVAMIVLGVYLAQTDIGKMLTTPRLYWGSAVRLVIIPAATILVLLPFAGKFNHISMALLLVAAAPVGSNVAVYAQKLDLDYTYAVQTICISTILSIISMPLMIGLAQNFFAAA